MKRILILILFVAIFLPATVFARVSVNDVYQEKRQAWEQQIAKLSQANQIKVKKADELLKQINLVVCSRFDADIAIMTAIDAQIRERRGMDSVPTQVAYGSGNTPLENAEYWLNYAQEAVAYQKIADYTTNINGDSSVDGAINSEKASLKSDLGVLANKILRAKSEIAKILNEK